MRSSLVRCKQQIQMHTFVERIHDDLVLGAQKFSSCRSTQLVALMHAARLSLLYAHIGGNSNCSNVCNDRANNLLALELASGAFFYHFLYEPGDLGVCVRRGSRER